MTVSQLIFHRRMLSLDNVHTENEFTFTQNFTEIGDCRAGTTGPIDMESPKFIIFYNLITRK